MENIPKEKRPKCSCGNEMKIVEYSGYYDEFKYFECRNCDLDPDNFKEDDRNIGQYSN